MTNQGKSIDIVVGVTTSDRGDPTLSDTLSSLSSAGFSRPRIFADGGVGVPEGYEVSRRIPTVGGWPNFLLGINELVLRQPQADGYLMVQDDVVFSRRLHAYLSSTARADGVGAYSLFTPICYNDDFGWNAVKTGMGFCGAQAIYFSGDRARQFIGSPFVANYRNDPPKLPHYRQDGLHHIDGVIGEWCRRANLRICCHSPSLSQHIGVSSSMYESRPTNIIRRYADSFPGEHLDAPFVYGAFLNAVKRWSAAGNPRMYEISAEAWAVISQALKKGTPTLEFGVGLSTMLFESMGCEHHLVEKDPVKMDRYLSTAGGCRSQWLRRLPKSKGGGPDRLHRIRCVYVGPNGMTLKSKKKLSLLVRCLASDGRVCVLGTNQPSQRAVAYLIAKRLGWDLNISTSGGLGFAIIESSATLLRPPLWQ